MSTPPDGLLHSGGLESQRSHAPCLETQSPGRPMQEHRERPIPLSNSPKPESDADDLPQPVWKLKQGGPDKHPAAVHSRISTGPCEAASPPPQLQRADPPRSRPAYCPQAGPAFGDPLNADASNVFCSGESIPIVYSTPYATLQGWKPNAFKQPPRHPQPAIPIQNVPSQPFPLARVL